MDKQADIRAIEGVIENYRRASYAHDAELFATVFHPGAVVNGVAGPEHMSFPAPEFIGLACSGGTTMEEEGCDFRIVVDEVDVDGPCAHAKFHEYDNHGTDYVTHFLLTKRDGTWGVVAKLFLVA